MQHNITIDGAGFRLRPVELADAAFIVAIRTANPERTRFIHPISQDISLQEQWLDEYAKRQDDYYWLLERRANSSPEGVISIYDFDHDRHCAEWGRWVLKPQSLAAVESVLLIHRIAFDHFGLEVLISNTNAENHSVVSFHKSCGFRCIGLRNRFFEIDGHRYDAITHACSRWEWPEIEARLLKSSEMVSRHLQIR